MDTRGRQSPLPWGDVALPGAGRSQPRAALAHGVVTGSLYPYCRLALEARCAPRGLRVSRGTWNVPRNVERPKCGTDYGSAGPR